MIVSSPTLEAAAQYSVTTVMRGAEVASDVVCWQWALLHSALERGTNLLEYSFERARVSLM
jgi:hypothetical protein